MLYPFRSLVPRLGGLILEGDIFDETMGVKRFQRICALRHRPLMCRGGSTDGGNMEIPRYLENPRKKGVVPSGFLT